jgi:hypothetical protein
MYFIESFLINYQNNVSGRIEEMLGSLKKLKIMQRRHVHYD